MRFAPARRRLRARVVVGSVPAIRPVGRRAHSRQEKEAKARRMSDWNEAAPTRADGSLAWSELMARAQAGDKIAYRRLLEDITPYLRSRAARHALLFGEVEDVVQDVLLTVHTVRHTYDPRPAVRAVAAGDHPPADRRPAAPPGQQDRGRGAARAAARGHCRRRRESLSAALGPARPASRDREVAGRPAAGDPAAQAARAVAEGGGARERALDRSPQGCEPPRPESVAGDAGRAGLRCGQAPAGVRRRADRLAAGRGAGG